MTDSRKTARGRAGEHVILIALAALVVLFGSITENCFSLVTLTTILNQIPALTAVTVGMTFVLIVGGIDLSVGSVLGLGAVTVGVAAVNPDVPLAAACSGSARDSCAARSTARWRVTRSFRRSS